MRILYKSTIYECKKCVLMKPNTLDFHIHGSNMIICVIFSCEEEAEMVFRNFLERGVYDANGKDVLMLG